MTQQSEPPRGQFKTPAGVSDRECPARAAEVERILEALEPKEEEPSK